MIEEHKIKYRGVDGIPLVKAEKAERLKTGTWRVYKPVRNEKCIKCKLCWQLCPENAIRLDKEGKPHFDYEICKGCGICAVNCPVKAIEMERDFHGKDVSKLQK